MNHSFNEYVPPDPENRWSTERREFLRLHWPTAMPARELLGALNRMIGLPINSGQAAAYAKIMTGKKRPPEAIEATRRDAVLVMRERNAALAEQRNAARGGLDAEQARAKKRADLAAARKKDREQRAEHLAAEKARRAERKKAERKRAAATMALLISAEERRRITEKRNRLTELFLADQQRLDILRMEQERRAAELAASKPVPRPQRQRDPAVPSQPFSMSVMKMPDPRLEAYQEQRRAASRGRVSDSYVAPLTRTLPE